MAIHSVSNPGTAGISSGPAVPSGNPAGTNKVTLPAEPEVAAHPPDEQRVQHMLTQMKQLVETKAPNSLSFSIDQETGKTIVRVTDVQTGEMIRQIPSEEMVELAKSLDKLQGMLLQQKA